MQLVLVEVLGHEFSVTLHRTQAVADVCNTEGCIYAFQVSTTSSLTNNNNNNNNNNTAAEDHGDAVISAIALSCDVKKARRLIRTFLFL